MMDATGAYLDTHLAAHKQNRKLSGGLRDSKPIDQRFKSSRERMEQCAK